MPIRLTISPQSLVPLSGVRLRPHHILRPVFAGRRCAHSCCHRVRPVSSTDMKPRRRYFSNSSTHSMPQKPKPDDEVPITADEMRRIPEENYNTWSKARATGNAGALREACFTTPPKLFQFWQKKMTCLGELPAFPGEEVLGLDPFETRVWVSEDGWGYKDKLVWVSVDVDMPLKKPKAQEGDHDGGRRDSEKEEEEAKLKSNTTILGIIYARYPTFVKRLRAEAALEKGHRWSPCYVVLSLRERYTTIEVNWKQVTYSEKTEGNWAEHGIGPGLEISYNHHKRPSLWYYIWDNV